MGSGRGACQSGEWRKLARPRAALKQRGLAGGGEFIVSEDHAALKLAIFELLTEAAWQRCYVHFPHNAVDRLPRKHDEDRMTELRWLYDRRDLEESWGDLAAWLNKWQGKYPKLCK